MTKAPTAVEMLRIVDGNPPWTPLEMEVAKMVHDWEDGDGELYSPFARRLIAFIRDGVRLAPEPDED